MLRPTITILMFGALAACGSDSDRAVVAPPEAPNTAPVIAAVEDLVFAANGSSPVSVSISDDQTPLDALTLEVQSGNTALIDDDGLELAGTDGNRTLVITPQADQTGEAVITLVVTDAQQLESSTSFTIIVAPQSVAFSATVRSIFASDENAMPRQLNALEFQQDGGDFDDLVAM